MEYKKDKHFLAINSITQKEISHIESILNYFKDKELTIYEIQRILNKTCEILPKLSKLNN